MDWLKGYSAHLISLNLDSITEPMFSDLYVSSVARMHPMYVRHMQ